MVFPYADEAIALANGHNTERLVPAQWFTVLLTAARGAACPPIMMPSEVITSQAGWRNSPA